MSKKVTEKMFNELTKGAGCAAPNDYGRAVDRCNVGQCFGHGRSHAGSTGTAAERSAGNLAVCRRAGKTPMKQTNERLCALAQKGDAAALDSLIDNNKSFIGKVANDLFRSMNSGTVWLEP